MNWINKRKYRFGKLMSSRPVKQLKWLSVLLAGVVIFVALIALFPIKCFDFWKALGSFFSPVPMYHDGHHFIRFIAYLVGTIVFSGVIIALLTNIIRTYGERYVNGTAHYKFKGHILFLGYDEMMIGTLKNELRHGNMHEKEKGEKNDERSDVVIAVPDKVAIIRKTIYQYLSKEEAERVFVIQASRINVDDLKEVAQVLAAKKIFIIGQPDEETHDAVNLNCLGLIAALKPRQQSGVLVPCYYYLRNQSTFYLIHRMEYKAENFKKDIESAKLSYDEANVELFIKASEPFNFYESIARHVLFGSTEQGKDTLQLNTTKGDPHLIIYGMTPMGVALMRDVLMTQHFSGRRLHVTMVDENAKEEMHYLIGRHRPFFENCQYSFCNLNEPLQNINHSAVLDFLDVEVEFIQSDVAHPQLAKYLRDCVETEEGSLAIAICNINSPQNMALALYMPRQVFEAKVPIWVFQTGDNSMNAFVENDDKNNLYSSIRVFSTVDYGISDRRRSWQWQLAKTVSDDYAQKHPYDSNYKWETSQPSGRWSSLYGALSKISMLRSIGKDRTPILLKEKEVAALACAEHNRWNTEKLLNGWEPAPQGMGKTLFRHDKIVQYEKLDANTKVKDSEQIEAVIMRLNRNGKTHNG